MLADRVCAAALLMVSLPLACGAGPWQRVTVVTRESSWQVLAPELREGQGLVLALSAADAGRSFEARAEGMPSRTLVSNGLVVTPLGGHVSVRLVLGPGQVEARADLEMRAITAGKDVFDASTPASMRSLEREILDRARASLAHEREDLERTAEATGTITATARRRTQLTEALALIDGRVAALKAGP